MLSIQGLAVYRVDSENIYRTNLGTGVSMSNLFRISTMLLGAAIASWAYTPPSAVVSALNSYRGFSELTSAAGSMDPDTYAKNLITWQMDHGGFCKAYASKYTSAWDNSTAKCSWTNGGTALGTFDNNATVQEMRYLATRYKATTNATNKAAFQAAFQKAVGFVLKSQPASGGWPQVYPERENYSDMATYNDNAMVRVMVLVQDIVNGAAPFDSDIITSTQKSQLTAALAKAVDFALKAQIVNGGVPTVWCAQHDPVTYKPVGARAYELASKSGSESAGIVWFLMNWPDQSAVIQNAVKGALNWYKKNKVSDLKFSNGEFVASAGASMWYRFYEVDSDAYFFCDREGESTKTQDITQISAERRTGYQWAGDYGSKLLSVESAYLSAIASVVNSSSSAKPSSSSVTSSSSVASSSSSSATSSSSVAVATEALCGSTQCITVLQGEEFCNIQGVAESKNGGYMGSGYANADNAADSAMGTRIEVSADGQTTIYIRYANGGGAARNAKLLWGSKVLLEILEFPATASWTDWATLQVNVDWTAGNDSLVLQPLSASGLANIDWLGWNVNTLNITASCAAPPPLAIVDERMRLQVSPVRIRTFDLMGRGR